MNISTIKRIALIIFLCLGASTIILAGKTSVARNGGVPVEVSTDPSNPSANQLVHITVTLSAEVSSDQPVAMGCLDPYSYADLPSEVTVPSGYSSVTFTATTTSSYAGGADIAATCNGVTAVSGGGVRP